jgi:hypothetical protein
MALVRGVGAYFALEDGGSPLGGSPAELTDISGWLDNIEGSSSMSEYDGTCFQPGVAVPVKVTVPGFADKGYTLSGKWSAEVESFFAPIEGMQGLGYAYGPDGTTAGKPMIYGVCNLMSYSGPKAPVDGLVTFDVTLKVTTRTVGTF